MSTPAPKVESIIIPAAGLGTRFMPAAKAIPKEMLPIADTPTIQLIVEEAVAAGIRQVILVTGRNKESIVDHFDYAYELETTLRSRGKTAEADRLKAIADQVEVIAIRQKEPRGLGHAVLAAHPVVGNRPAAVLLGDDLIFRTSPAQRPAIKQLMDASAAVGGRGVIALMGVPREQIHMYGAAEGSFGEGGDPRLMRITALVEKPPKGTEKTDQAVIGRYVLPATIWDALKHTRPGAGGEIQLTDALAALARGEGLYGYQFEGRRIDAGDKVGFLEASLFYALSRPDLQVATRSMMERLLQEVPR
ncbi:MAG: UTP--glucose-1-phosphate uridylyltransferase [Deltaproteobacteria bacterium]|nr:UTP--glucose-1-phosphate uridylyltransferase [Deltaproteobacteria bacterium]